MTQHEKHIAHYSILISGLGLLGVLFILFRYNEPLQIFVGGLGCLFYILWGIFHHALEERITKLVVFEYVSFGLLGLILLILFVTI
ncbi:hypothetical protein GF360_02220 [candidate division WWE3 bacterium]|nr:hypothetical protein [candidate division WWE3 bacterium]